jgi:diguanylate cyclase (GGDEF)-like protein/PAS domain S-box-containing protein
VRTDAAGRIDYVNPMGERLSGWPRDEALGRTVPEVMPISTGFSTQHFDVVACALGLRQVVILPKGALLIPRGGKQFAVQGLATPLVDARHGAVGVVVTMRDVSEMRGLERDLTFLAAHDLLTGLLNRPEFDAQVQLAIHSAASGLPRAICYIDLDNFGVINDAHGHLAGDEVLRQVAALLRTRIRQGDCVSRMGGDEFAVLLDGCKSDDVGAAAGKLHAELATISVPGRGGPFQVRASIGAVALTGDIADPLRAAEAACRAAHERGGNCTQLYSLEDTAVIRRAGQVTWLHRLNDALTNHRFALVRQRMSPLRDGAALPPIYEVLLRLPAQDSSEALPTAFLPAAERYHLSQAIDRWVVSRVLETLSTGSHILDILSINITAQSLGSAEFLGFLKAEIAASRVGAERLCFEITEHGVISDLRRAGHFIEEIKSLGCRFFLDDFGRGMSSLTYLHELPVDFLKIDGKLVSGAGEDPVRRTMLESIQQIGHVMHLQTVGEGVEDQATLALLAELGIDFAQGYLVHRPEPFVLAPQPGPVTEEAHDD